MLRIKGVTRRHPATFPWTGASLSSRRDLHPRGFRLGVQSGGAWVVPPPLPTVAWACSFAPCVRLYGRLGLRPWQGFFLLLSVPYGVHSAHVASSSSLTVRLSRDARWSGPPPALVPDRLG